MLRVCVCVCVCVWAEGRYWYITMGLTAPDAVESIIVDVVVVGPQVQADTKFASLYSVAVDFVVFRLQQSDSFVSHVYDGVICKRDKQRRR